MHTSMPPPHTQSQLIVGDVAEPFWVQPAQSKSHAHTAVTGAAVWADPDELFMADARRLLSSTDRRLFWEMVRALIELPEISLAVQSGPRSVAELTALLVKAEHRVLWSFEAPEYLPKQMAVELIRAAYVDNGSVPGGPSGEPVAGSASDLKF